MSGSRWSPFSAALLGASGHDHDRPRRRWAVQLAHSATRACVAHVHLAVIVEADGGVAHRTAIDAFGALLGVGAPTQRGVEQCGADGDLVALHQLPVLLPNDYPYWLAVFGAALIYAMSFNWLMAVREARFLERCFGESYRRYRTRVPFVVPLLSPNSRRIQ